MEQEIKKSEFLTYLDWLFLGLSGNQILTITNLENTNDVALISWKAVVNDRDQTTLILNKIKNLINIELVLETHTSLGVLRRKCTYNKGLITNNTDNEETDNNITDIDLLVNWGEG